MTSPGNDAMRAYWSGDAGQFWAERGDTIDSMLNPYSRAVRDALALQPGERVLDVGCGHGTDTIALGRCVTPDGCAVGVDISDVLIDEARRRAKAAGSDATFMVADAQGDDVGGPYDAVFSRFGVMFFADPVAAFANVRAATVPNGRLGFVCWQRGEANPLSVIVVGAVQGILELPPMPPPDAPGPAAFARRERAREVVEGGGWRDVSVESFPFTQAIAPADVIQRLFEMGPARAAYAQASPAVQEEARAAVQAVIEPFAVDDHYEFPQAAWLVTARS